MLKLSELKITLQCHEELNPKLWDGDDLKSTVHDTLIKFADAWIQFAKIPKEMVQDIVMTGGNANYNYTAKSDIDVHVIIDRSKLFTDAKFVEEYLQTKKSLWTLTHKVEVYGYSIEPYAQDVTINYPKSQGVYSLKNKKWIMKPAKCNYDFKNDSLLKQKVRDYMHAIDQMITSKMGNEQFQVLKSKLKNMRAESIEKYGEYGRENLVFKELRNRGYLDKMNKYQTSLKDKELSLK